MTKALPTHYQEYIHLSRYARYRDELGRRETWEETIDRYLGFFKNRFPSEIDATTYEELKDAIINLEIMPSMRCLMTAGKALERDEVAGYNCSFVAVDNQRVFDEIMYVLMCGTGVGFSVERQFINKLPEVHEELHDTSTVIKVRDSKIGWASSFRELISLLYAGKIPKWDVSKIRPAGERLKTFGGRASGPEPLEDLFMFSIELFKKAAGRKLSSLECHDLVCKIADIVVVGGVRRSALISLSNLSDDRMRDSKSGKWWEENAQRALANNSACYTEKPDIGIFMKEWVSLYDSKSGERGMFNRQASIKQAAKNGRRDSNFEFGTNPCSEIILRSKQFCNLSEVVVRHDDTKESLTRKIRLATILGTLQSSLTNFRYLSKAWKNNTKEERLLGVSLTGIMDHPVLNNSSYGILGFDKSDSGLSTDLENLRDVSIETNKLWSEKLDIPHSTAITCVKPSGTVSQLVDSASGIHTRHSEYYIRTVRADKKDPLATFMVKEGFPVEDDVTKPDYNHVFSFPIKSPDNSITRKDVTAIEQLDIWKIYQEHWCEHKPSITVSVKEDEWLDVGAWVYKHFDIVSGVSFLPYSEHIYRQAPYQDCNKETYDEWLNKMPKSINWLDFNEAEDNTIGAQELACSSGSCELA